MLHQFAASSQRHRLNKQGLLVKDHHQKHMKHFCLLKTRPHGAQATSGAHYAADEDVFIFLSHLPNADIADMCRHTQLGKQPFH